MNFEVKANQLTVCARDETDIQTQVSKLHTRLNVCRQQLPKHLSSSASWEIDTALEEACTAMEFRAKEVGALSRDLDLIARMYAITEERIVGNRTIADKNAGTAANQNGETTGNSNSGDHKAISDFLSLLSKIVSALGYGSDSDALDALASLLNALASGSVMLDSGNTAEWIDNMLGLSGDAMGAAGDIAELFAKYGSGNKEYVSAISEIGGIADAVIDFVQDFKDAVMESDSVAEFLKKSNDWIASGGSLYQTVMGLGEDALQRIVPAATLASMSAYAAGEFLERYTDDGVFSLYDYSQLLLGTGLQGASSMLSGFTHGIVDIDTEEAIGIFNDNISDAKTWIDSQEWTGWQKFGAKIVSSPAVAAWSVGEVLVNEGMDIGNKIMGIFR